MGKLDLIKNLAMNSSALAVTKVNSKTAEKIVTSPTLKVQPKDAFVKSCECSFKFDDSKCVVFGEFPKEYVNIEKSCSCRTCSLGNFTNDKTFLLYFSSFFSWKRTGN